MKYYNVQVPFSIDSVKKIFVTAWSPPKPTAPNSTSSVVPSESWPWSSDLANNSENTVGGWADFSSATFDANFAGFNDIKKNTSNKSENSPTVKLDDIKPMPQKKDDVFEESKKEIDDVQMGNVEGQTDVSKTVSESGVDRIAQPDGTQSHADENVKSAAGDQGDDSMPKGSDNKSGAAEFIAEPSK